TWERGQGWPARTLEALPPGRVLSSGWAVCVRPARLRRWPQYSRLSYRSPPVTPAIQEDREFGATPSEQPVACACQLQPGPIAPLTLLHLFDGHPASSVTDQARNLLVVN